MKNNPKKIQKILKSKEKTIALVAPSFVAEFEYPAILSQLKSAGFDKIVELTFGAKMINREYHRILESSDDLLITSVCPGIVQIIKQKYPQYKKNLAKIDSPMIATAKICKKFYPKHKTIFISPCHFKKTEAESCPCIDYTIDYQQLKQILPKKSSSHQEKFDKFYNDYTKVYPLSGGLSKTAHLKQVLKPGQEKIIDGISDVEKFLQSPDKRVRFLDVTFCKGGCIGGPCLSAEKSLKKRKQRVLDYMKLAEKESIRENSKGVIKKAQGIKFSH